MCSSGTKVARKLPLTRFTLVFTLNNFRLFETGPPTPLDFKGTEDQAGRTIMSYNMVNTYPILEERNHQ